MACFPTHPFFVVPLGVNPLEILDETYPAKLERVGATVW